MGVAVNIATLLSGVKEMVTQGYRKQYEESAMTYAMWGDGKAEFIGGKGWRIANELRPPVGVGGISEGGSFNQPGAETTDDMYIYSMSMTIALEITGTVYRNAQNSDAMVDNIKTILGRRTSALRKEANYQMFDDGAGARATYKSGTTTPLFYNAIDHTPLAGLHTTKGSTHLKIGERYDWYDSTFTTLRQAGVKILTKPTRKTATIAAAVAGATDGDKLVLQNSLFKMPRGIPYIINNSGIFQLQDRAVYPELNAVVRDLNGSYCGVADFTFTKNLLLERAEEGKAQTVVALMSLCQDNLLRNLGLNLKRWDGAAKSFDGSFDKFEHGDTISKVDKDCGESDIWLTYTNGVQRYTEKKMDLFDEDGQEMRQPAGALGYGADALRAAMGTWQNFGSEMPKDHAVIKRCGVAGGATQVAAG